jgi:hypothetical protein
LCGGFLAGSTGITETMTLQTELSHSWSAARTAAAAITGHSMPAASKVRSTSVTSHSKRSGLRDCANDRYRPRRSALLDPLRPFTLREGFVRVD